MIAPNTGSLIMPGNDDEDPTIIDGALGGRSSIVDYKGTILASNNIVGDSYIASEINIDALRHYRENARFQNWIPYLKTEIFSKMYEQEIWPKNLPSMKHDDAGKVFKKTIKKLIKKGIFTPRTKK
jgi:hypothetical protein